MRQEVAAAAYRLFRYAGQTPVPTPGLVSCKPRNGKRTKPVPTPSPQAHSQMQPDSLLPLLLPHPKSTTDTSKPDTGSDHFYSSSQMKTFPNSSFFKEKRAPTLPTPADIRAINQKSDNVLATNFNRPQPLRIPSLGLFVKYGADVTIVEAQTQIMVREKLQGRVPVPEVFGWAEDGGQRFIYMSLIEGETLQERWRDMNDHERWAICKELRYIVEAWRSLKQDTHDYYIGSQGKQPLNDIFLAHRPELTGPFQGVKAVKQFQDACGIEISTDVPIIFTHSDLVAPNILLSLGPNLKVAAIIDWGQAGWYPAYWEYCKARRVRLNPEHFSDALQEEWRTKYLPLIMDPVHDETYYHPWLYFVLSKGI